jgi:hypothetical protein
MLSLLIFIVLPAAKALFCSNYYDYTGDRVRCVPSCPASSKIKDNKCLLANQYVINQNVHLCSRGWVDEQNNICCPRTH